MTRLMPFSLIVTSKKAVFIGIPIMYLKHHSVTGPGLPLREKFSVTRLESQFWNLFCCLLLLNILGWAQKTENISFSIIKLHWLSTCQKCNVTTLIHYDYKAHLELIWSLKKKKNEQLKAQFWGGFCRFSLQNAPDLSKLKG